MAWALACHRTAGCGTAGRPWLGFASSLLALAATTGTGAQPSDEPSNLFGDPFFQASDAIPHCPEPLGPRLTVAERPARNHHRAERGTSCWLAGQCDRPNSYLYDADIAQALRAALPGEASFAGSTLWITVQGRVVYIEGCVRDTAVAPRLEAFAMRTADVQQAIASVYADLASQPPYAVMPRAKAAR